MILNIGLMTVKVLGFKSDIVSTSETYGLKYIEILEGKNYIVDIDRKNVPISGTLIRSNPFKYWDYIDKPLREFYTKRIAIIGPESTGKTTLCQKLGEYYNTNWVSEYGREYAELKLVCKEQIEYKWKYVDFINIAKEQNIKETLATRNSNKLLFCDTNSFATYIWHKRYMGYYSDELLNIYKTHPKPYLVFLMKPDVEFVQDGTRDGEHIRQDMYMDFIEKLNENNIKYSIIEGNYNKRFKTIMEKLI